MKKSRKPKQTYQVTPEQVITVWQTSETAQEAAEKLGMPLPILHARVCSYRRRGWPLKSMNRRRGRHKLDNERLRQLASDLLPEGAVVPVPKKLPMMILPPEGTKPKLVLPEKDIRQIIGDVVKGVHKKKK